MTEPDDSSADDTPSAEHKPTGAARRRAVLLRLDPAVHEALAHWASDELRSVNAQIEIVLRRALADAGRAPAKAGPLPRRGRPPATDRSPED